MKPEIKYEDGKIKAKASVQVDTDKDGVPSLIASVEVEINAMEAVNEIVKDKVPQWLKDLIGKKELEQA